MASVFVPHMWTPPYKPKPAVKPVECKPSAPQRPLTTGEKLYVGGFVVVAALILFFLAKKNWI